MIDEMKKEEERQTIEFARRYQEQNLEFEKKEGHYQAELERLQQQVDKLIKELMQVKQILKAPYLYKVKFSFVNFLTKVFYRNIVKQNSTNFHT